MPFRSIRRRLSVSLVAVTLIFGLASVVFVQTIIRQKLVAKLQEKGVVIARKIASDSVNAVITERFFEMTMMLKDVQAADPDVVYAYVAAEDGRDLASTFDGVVPPELKRAHPLDFSRLFSTRELETDRGPVLDVGVPLLRGQIGSLHLGLSLTPIRRDVRQIEVLIVLFAIGTLGVGVVAAIAISRIITRPLVILAGAAAVFGRGGAQQPVSVTSNDEVGELARVFNAMMASRKQAELEQARLIAELQRTLGEVKCLRGLLPICSSCKKIRRDEGSWQQIESYIREHSEADFSHGICPDCAQRLYPDLWEKIKARTGSAPG